MSIRKIKLRVSVLSDGFAPGEGIVHLKPEL